MFINRRQGAIKGMIIFALLDFVGIAMIAVAGYCMTQIPHQDFAWWVLLGCVFVGIFTFFWTTLGVIFNYIDYKSLSQGVVIDFDLDAIEKEMDKITQEMSLEELAAMEAEVAEGFEADFDKLFNQ